MLTRRAFVPLLGSPLLAQPRQPNIIFILTDDQGYGDLSLTGNEQLRTPNLDRIAKEGAQFTRFYASPVCSPTRACLLTGRYNYRTGVVDTYLGRSMMRPSEVTLAEMLKPAGYRTGIFGKWHLGDNYPLRAHDQGFDETLLHHGGGLMQPGDIPEALTGVKPSYFDPVLTRNGKWEPQKGYCTDIYFREALRFIDENRSRPFFLYLPTNAPHTPLEIGEEWAAPFRKPGVDDVTARIYGMIANVDHNVGKLLAHLKQRNLEQDTMLVFMTDNGPQQPRYNAGLRGLKGTPYEGGIRAPFFVRWPGRVAAGTKIDRLAAHIDFTPTALEAAGVKAPANLDGRSLMPLLASQEGAATWSDRTLYIQWHRGDAPRPFENSAVLTQRWKLVNGKELYDLESDPKETQDLAASEAGMVRQLRMSYEAWFQDVGSAGYEPPRIVIQKQSATLLTRQDWRGPQASWDANGLGYWEVEVAEAGRYEITLLFADPGSAAELSGTWIGKHAIAAGQTRLDLKDVALPAGKARFEANVAGKGLHYAWIR